VPPKMPPRFSFNIDLRLSVNALLALLQNVSAVHWFLFNGIYMNKMWVQFTSSFTHYPFFQWYPQSKKFLLNLGMKCWNSISDCLINSVYIVLVQFITFPLGTVQWDQWVHWIQKSSESTWRIGTQFLLYSALQKTIEKRRRDIQSYH